MIPRHYGIRTKRHKLMHFYQFKEEWEMYDLKDDPDELSNLYGKKETLKLQNRDKRKSGQPMTRLTFIGTSHW